MIKCQHCDGTGTLCTQRIGRPGTMVGTCGLCNGRGVITKEQARLDLVKYTQLVKDLGLRIEYLEGMLNE